MDLLCCEASEDMECRSYMDPAIADDDRVLANMLAAEDRNTITGSYFECLQTELKPYMRKVVVQWMSEVCEEQQCQPDVLWLAVNYMDRFLGLCRMNKSNLQLLGAVCLFLASKLKETLPLSADKLVQYTAQSITLDELWQWELLVLGLLRWDLCSISPHDFVDLIYLRMQFSDPQLRVDVANKDDVTRRLTHSFISICALEYKFVTCPPSMLACACIAAALRESARRIGLSTSAVTSHVFSQLQQLTQIESDYIRNCLEQVEEFLGNHFREMTLVRSNQTSEPDVSAKMGVPVPVAESEKAATPTDIRDIHF